MFIFSVPRAWVWLVLFSTFYVLPCVVTRQDYRHSAQVPMFQFQSFIDTLGQESPSIEHACYIRDILQKIGVYQKVTLRKMNAYAIDFMGYHNAFVICDSSGQAYMYINEQWFNELMDPEKRFLIGHESCHIKHGDLHKNIDSCTAEGAKIIRQCEKKADIVSAITLRCIDGGISLLRFFTTGSMPQSKDPYRTHPTPQQRKKYLSRLKGQAVNAAAIGG